MSIVVITMRATSEHFGRKYDNCKVIRINPEKPQIDPPHISLKCGAMEGITAIEQCLLKH